MTTAALNGADVTAIERADTPAKARDLMGRLTAERASGATEKRAQEIDGALRLLKQAYPEVTPAPPKPGNALHPAPSPASPAPSPRPAPSPAKPGKKPAAKAPRSGRAPKALGRRSTGKARGVGRKVVAEAVGHTTSAGQMVVGILGATIAFAGFYLLITNANRAPKGSAAIELIGSGFTTFIAAVVDSSVDPLNPHGASTPKATPAGTDPAPAAPLIGPPTPPVTGVSGSLSSTLSAARKTAANLPTQTHTKGSK